MFKNRKAPHGTQEFDGRPLKGGTFYASVLSGGAA